MKLSLKLLRALLGFDAVDRCCERWGTLDDSWVAAATPKF